MTKPKILLCWAYQRSGYVKIFNALRDDFDFVYLNYIFEESETKSFVQDNKIYWSEFINVNDLLTKIKPDKVLFMGLDNPMLMLLNAECKSKNIKTIFLQHGIFDTYETYREREDLERENPPAQVVLPPNLPNKRFGIQFLLRSFNFTTWTAFVSIAMLKFLAKALKSEQRAIYYLKTPHRFADVFLVYTKFCAQVLKTRDGVSDERLVEIGNPEADEILNANNDTQNTKSSQDYLLLVENIIAEAEGYSNSVISKENVNEYYFKLNEYAKEQSKKLYIKLHPYSYYSTFFMKDENIVYIRDVDDISKLIRESAAVFGSTSTLLIPALVLKKCCLFRFTKNSLLLDFLEEINYCPVLDYFSFSVEDIHFNDAITMEQSTQFQDAYLYKADGKSVERIKQQLLSY